jgi:hypothetical protein
MGGRIKDTHQTWSEKAKFQKNVDENFRLTVLHIVAPTNPNEKKKSTVWCTRSQLEAKSQNDEKERKKRKEGRKE